MLQHAYNEITGKVLSDIDESSTLYRAMLNSFKNQDEFPEQKDRDK